MKDLILNLKKEYFLEIKNGTKPFEYRLVNDFWSKRLINKEYRNVIIKLGYPASSESEKILIFPYQGYSIKKITHPHFGENEVSVFAIKLYL